MSLHVDQAAYGGAGWQGCVQTRDARPLLCPSRETDPSPAGSQLHPEAPLGQGELQACPRGPHCPLHPLARRQGAAPPCLCGHSRAEQGERGPHQPLHTVLGGEPWLPREEGGDPTAETSDPRGLPRRTLTWHSQVVQGSRVHSAPSAYELPSASTQSVPSRDSSFFICSKADAWALGQSSAPTPTPPLEMTSQGGQDRPHTRERRQGRERPQSPFLELQACPKPA